MIQIRFQNNNIRELYRQDQITITQSILQGENLYRYAHSTRSYGICPHCRSLTKVKNKYNQYGLHQMLTLNAILKVYFITNIR